MLRTSLPGQRLLAGAAAAVAVAVLTAGAGSPALAATPAGAASAAAAQGWTVRHVAGGYRLTLRLAAPLPVRDALPELAVDGVVVGTAQESADGLRLTVVTKDPRVARASRVQVAWNGQVESTTPAGSARAPSARAARPQAQAAPGPATAIDPASPGKYAVTRADYDRGDTALTLPGLSNRTVEERAAVFMPVAAPGRRPVVLFLHGRHAACYDPVALLTSNTQWPCPAGYRPIPSYLGYNGSAQVLASHGYVVVSISANGINAQDALYADDAGTLARGQLVLDHLNLLAAADRGNAPGLSRLLKGKLDLTDVGLMGHSRGGEGVVKAALLNAARAKPYGIEAVLPLAPIDFGRETLPDVPMAIVLPYCDGDVSNQQGQHFYDDSRYADPTDKVLRSSLMVMGADHNFFNTEWTPGVAVAPASDDWRDAADPTCSSSSPTTTRLSAAEQYAVGVAYISGFFRMVMGNERALLPLFDGSGGTATSAGRATVYTEAQSPSNRRLDVATLTGPSSTVRTTGAGDGQYCASIGVGRSPSSPLPPCATSTSTSRFPHWTPANYAANVPAAPMMHFRWTAAGAQVRADLPAARRDVSGYDALTVRASRDDSTTDADLTLSVVDGKGATQSVRVADISDALSVFPGGGGTSTVLDKIWLRTVRLPVSSLTDVDVHDLRQVRLTATSATGGVYLSDLAFQDSAIGDGGPTDLPQVSVRGTAVNEGDGPSTVPVVLTLSARSTRPVYASFQSLTTSGAQIEAQAQEVVFKPGQRTLTVEVPLAGNTTPAATLESFYKVFVSNTRNAVVGQNYARVVVYDDDPQPPATLG